MLKITIAYVKNSELNKHYLYPLCNMQKIQAEKIKSIYAEAQMLFILQSDYFFTISLPKGPS